LGRWFESGPGSHLPRHTRLRRSAYVQPPRGLFFPTHTNPIEMTQGPAPFLQMGRIDIPPVVEDEFNDW
ncbi:MAG TPA: hypothetical protein VNV38_10960, partial [Stellaceae bacterium]|nr:hypothetical protein [Stellaceae bacterium]